MHNPTFYTPMRRKTALFALLLAAVLALPVQGQQYVRAIAFYNLENLFDTIHDEGKNDYEYLPDGGMKWTSHKYENKLQKMAYAISQIGTDEDPRGATCLGVAEVENIGCLEDLCGVLNGQYARRYKPLLLEGPDRRGVDVGFLYDSRHCFKKTYAYISFYRRPSCFFRHRSLFNY